MFDVIFPKNEGQRYYSLHYRYVLDILKRLNCTIAFQKGLDVDTLSFKCILNSKTVIFDYSDSSDVRALGKFPTFKFHTKITDLDKVTPFAPVSFYDWQEYNQLSDQICYIPTVSFDISCRQRPYAGALERRNKIQKLLKAELEGRKRQQYPPGQKCRVLTKVINQARYWREINKIEAAVFVPGQNNNILDRGHLQYMAFGCYTISPFLPEVLPYNRPLVPGTHYVQCKDDYSDLIDIIMKKRINSSQTYYKAIGENAKQLFKETCTPEVLGKWISRQL